MSKYPNGEGTAKALKSAFTIAKTTLEASLAILLHSKVKAVKAKLENFLSSAHIRAYKGSLLESAFTPSPSREIISLKVLCKPFYGLLKIEKVPSPFQKVPSPSFNQISLLGFSYVVCQSSNAAYGGVA